MRRTRSCFGLVVASVVLACEPPRAAEVVAIAPVTGDAAALPVASNASTAMEKGEGACKVDADCAVSDTLDAAVVGSHACCSYVCPPGRVVSREIERGLMERRNATCAKPPLCPPPAPCAPTQKTYTPRCVAGRCAAEVHVASPRHAEPQF